MLQLNQTVKKTISIQHVQDQINDVIDKISLLQHIYYVLSNELDDDDIPLYMLEDYVTEELIDATGIQPKNDAELQVRDAITRLIQNQSYIYTLYDTEHVPIRTILKDIDTKGADEILNILNDIKHDHAAYTLTITGNQPVLFNNIYLNFITQNKDYIETFKYARIFLDHHDLHEIHHNLIIQKQRANYMRRYDMITQQIEFEIMYHKELYKWLMVWQADVKNTHRIWTKQDFDTIIMQLPQVETDMQMLCKRYIIQTIQHWEQQQLKKPITLSIVTSQKYQNKLVLDVFEEFLNNIQNKRITIEDAVQKTINYIDTEFAPTENHITNTIKNRLYQKTKNYMHQFDTQS